MQDLTHGPVRTHIIRLTLFILVSMVMQTLYNLIDLYWVSRLGKEAVAAVSVSGNLMMVVMALTQVLGVGTAALVSHAAGRKDHERVQLVFNQSLCLSLVMAASFVLAAFALRDAYCAALSGDAATAALAKRFLLWFIPGMAFQFPLNALGSALRGIGNMRPGVIAQSATLLLNIVLAPFLIFGWGTGLPLGIAGAALATFIAVVAGVVGLMLYLARETTYLRVRWASWRPLRSVWGGMMGVGLPSGGEFGVMAIYLMFIYALIRPFGAEAQAGFGIGMRIMQSGFMPALAVAFACAAVAGQNFGARQSARVRETFVSGAWMVSAFMLLFTLLCHIAPAAMIRWFSADDAVVAVGEEYLTIISWNYFAFGLAAVSGGMFQGLGNTWPMLISSGVRIGLIVFPAYWLSRRPDFHLAQIWWLSVGSVTLQMMLCLLFLRRELARKADVSIAGAAATEAAG